MAFEKFNMNLDEYNSQLEELNANKEEKKKEYKDPTDGEYECVLLSLELGTNKAGDKLMLKGSFKILAGEFKNQRIWINRVLTGTCNDTGWPLVGIYSGYSLLWDETYMYSQVPWVPIWCAQYNSECDYPE